MFATAAPDRALTAFDLDQFQHQAARDRHRLGQLDRDPVADPDGQPGFGPHQGLAIGIMVEIFLAQGPHRQQPVGACLVQFHESAKACDPLNSPGECAAHTVRKIGREVAIIGIALGRHRAALGVGNMLGGVFQRLGILKP